MFIQNIQMIIASSEDIKKIVVPTADFDVVKEAITTIEVTAHDSHLVFFQDASGKLLDVHNISR